MKSLAEYLLEANANTSCVIDGGYPISNIDEVADMFLELGEILKKNKDTKQMILSTDPHCGHISVQVKGDKYKPVFDKSIEIKYQK